MSKTAVIALNGELSYDNNEYQKMLEDINAKFIAADGGALLLEKIGYKPDLILGDLDSLSNSDIKKFRNKDINIKKYPSEKDETDGELAINYCLEKNFSKIILIFALGGRFDQQFANVFLLEYALEHDVEAIIKEPFLEIGLVNHEKNITDKVDWGLSLLPLDKKVNDVHISGCKYPLDSFML